MATTGDGTDEDGYEITLGDASEGVDVDDILTFEDLEAGTRRSPTSCCASGPGLAGSERGQPP